MERVINWGKRSNMADPQPGNSVDRIEQIENAKTEVNQEANSAVSQLAKEALRLKLLKDLRDREVEASLLKPMIERDPHTNVPDTNKDGANRLVKAVVKVVTGVEKQVISPQGASVNLFQNIIQEKIVDKLTDNSTPYLYQLLSQATQRAITIDNLTQSYRETRPLFIINPILAESWVKVLQKTAISLGMTQPEAETTFAPINAANLEAGANQRQSRHNPRGENISLLGFENKKRLEALTRQLQERAQAGQGGYERSQQWMDQIFRGTVTPEAIASANLMSLPDAQELVLLANKVIETYGAEVINDSRVEKYFPRDERDKFTYEYLIDKGYLKDGKLTEEGKRMLKRTAMRAVNNLFKNVDAAPDQQFQDVYSEYSDGMTYRAILDTVNKLLDDEKIKAYFTNHQDDYLEFNRFIRSGVYQEVTRERELRELYHNVAIWMRTLTPDKIAEFMARYNVSSATSVTMDDFSGKIVTLAMSELERYEQFDIAKNKGMVKPGLFAGRYDSKSMYYDVADYTELENRLRRTVMGLQRYSKESSTDLQTLRDRLTKFHNFRAYDFNALDDLEDWELRRALNYANGIHLTQTIRGYEIPASARPPQGFEGTPNNRYDISAFLNPNYRWNAGRGGHRQMHVKEMFLAEQIVRRPEESLLKRLFINRWNPKKLHDEVMAYSEKKMSEKWQHIEDNWLYKDMDFRRLLMKFSLGGLASRAGWRMGGFKGVKMFEYVDQISEAIRSATEQEVISGEGFKFGKDWVQTYNILAETAGVGSRFWFDGERAMAYAREELWKHLKMNLELDHHLDQAELDKLEFEYIDGEKGGSAVFRLSDGQSYTFTDLIEVKQNVLRGQNFYDLLRRSPLDFLNNMMVITPELMTEGFGGTADIYFEHFLDENAIRHAVEATGKHGKHANDEVNKIIIFQRNLNRIWGAKNIKHLVRIRGFLKGLEGLTDEKDKKNILNKFYEQMDLAVERVKFRSGGRMEPKDIEDEQIRNLVFGEEGLIPYFENLHEDFGSDWKRDSHNGLSQQGTLGEMGFFYHVARGWYNELGHNMHPNTADMDWRFVFQDIGYAAGENLVKRLWGDLAAYNETLKEFSNLDHLFQDAAHHHSLDKIMELHKKIHGLEGIAGKPGAYEMNYYLAQLVARYFQEHNEARLPFGIGMIYSLFHGKELSLSKIYGGRGAMSMTSDGLNAYFQQLAHEGIIPEEGVFGFERLSKTLGVDWKRNFMGEILPNIAMALAIFLLWKFIKDALAEAEGKKK